MALSRKGRLAKHLKTLQWHVHMIGKLEFSRDNYERDGLKVMVLAVNYEIMSHASRALAELRKAEELSGGEVDGTEMREYLAPKVDLPAVRRDEVDSVPGERVDSLYSDFVEGGKGKSARQTEYDRNRGLP